MLWIDKGKQIYFGEAVGMACDAYEEFLITKKVPAGEAETAELAEAYRARLAEAEGKKQQSEQERLLELLRQSSRTAAEKAAQAFLSNR